MANTNYDDSSISMLHGANRIRTRPASVLGSSGIAGARHGFTEIYGNALDERSAGFGDKLDVVYYKDGSVSLRDYGRGVPLGWNDKSDIKNWNWHVIYNELYGGGKYENYQEELKKIVNWDNFDPTTYNYLFSVGLNGLGAASTQYTSEFFEVKSYRDGKCTSRSFKKGIPLVNGEPFDVFKATQEEIESIPEEIEDTDEPNGTYIHWKPDSEVFDDVDLKSNWLLETCRDVADVAGIELHFVDENTDTDIIIPSGTITNMVKTNIGSKAVLDDNDDPIIFTTDNFTHGITKVEGKDFIYVGQCEIAFGLTRENIDNKCFHNSVKMVSGIQYEAIDDAVRKFFVDKAKAQGLKLDANDYASTFHFVVKSFSNYASFRNQTKDAVDDLFIYHMINDAISNLLAVEYSKGNKYITAAVERVLAEAELRMQLKAYEKIKRETNKIKREKAPEKFVSCDAYEHKDYKRAELWITEGDSAKGSVKDARNKEFQAIYPIRGKGLNVTKASLEKILANKEIREIFSLLGTGFDLPLKGEKTFNIEDLRFNKIVIATDADEDGYQIRVLLFLTFYKLAPQLITDGHVFIAETPRFMIDLLSGGRKYARNDKERDKIIKENTGNIVKVSRFKGLGEVNAEILRETTVHPDTRNFVKVDCDLSNETERELIDALFGADKYKQRKSIITAVLGAEVRDMFDDNALMIQSIEDSDIEEETELEEIAV